MKGKIWIPLVIVAVALVAFVVGWQFRGTPEPTEEVALSEPAPLPETPPAVEEPPPPPPPAVAPRPRRRSAPRPRTREVPAEPEPLAEPPAQAVSPPAPARTSVRRLPQPIDVRVAEGTQIVFTLNDSLSTKTNRAGDPFSGLVSRSVRVGDKVAIPEGSVVRGTVTRVKRAGRVKGRAELSVRFEQLELPDGQLYDLSASLSEVGEEEKETVTEEGQVKGEGSKKRDAVTIGAGGGIGAAIGAIAGGGKGTAIGAGAGAAAGTAAVLLTRGRDVELKRGSELALQLNRPLTVRVK